MMSPRWLVFRALVTFLLKQTLNVRYTTIFWIVSVYATINVWLLVSRVISPAYITEWTVPLSRLCVHKIELHRHYSFLLATRKQKISTLIFQYNVNAMYSSKEFRFISSHTQHLMQIGSVSCNSFLCILLRSLWLSPGLPNLLRRGSGKTLHTSVLCNYWETHARSPIP